METQAQTTIIPMQQVPPASVMQQAGVIQRGTVNVSAVRVLAIIQTVIGFLVVTFGFALVFYQENGISWSGILGMVGIPGGALMFVAGALGIASYKDPQNHCKNGFHMAFSILACCASSVGIGLFSVGALMYFGEYDNGCSYRNCALKVFIGISLFLVTTEFIVALTSAIFTCLFACCGTSGCCENSQKGVIMYPGNQQYIVTSESGQTVMASAYPPGSVPHFVSCAGMYPNQSGVSQCGGAGQVSSTSYYPDQVIATEAKTTRPMQGATSVTYSGQGPPPAYPEKEQLGHAS